MKNEMKSILLIGSNNRVYGDLFRCLKFDFHVQLCGEDPKQIQTSMDIVRPNMAVVCLVGINGDDEAILKLLADRYDAVPVLVIGTKDECGAVREYGKEGKVEFAVRPILNSDLVKHCRKLLKLTPTGESIDEANKRKEKKQILVCDDSPIILRTIKAMLEDNYDISAAKSGEQALRLLKNKKVDLILLDYEMPEMDGRQVFEQLRSNQETKDIPVVFLTGVSSREHILRVLKLKPEGYLLKPPVRERLIEAIEAAVKGEQIDSGIVEEGSI